MIVVNHGKMAVAVVAVETSRALWVAVATRGYQQAEHSRWQYQQTVVAVTISRALWVAVATSSGGSSSKQWWQWQQAVVAVALSSCPIHHHRPQGLILMILPHSPDPAVPSGSCRTPASAVAVAGCQVQVVALAEHEECISSV